MLRKWVLIVGTFLLLAVFLAACQGPQGELGPVGPAGPAGPEGPAGPVGEAAPTSQGGGEAAVSQYIGDQTCAGCHNSIAQKYVNSGHPWGLTQVKEGVAPSYPFTKINALPRGYSLKDISYIIGGYFWKAIFVDSKGYLITNAPGTSDDTAYLNQLNFGNTMIGLSSSWTSYHSGEAEVSFTCGSCHTTGYDMGGSQDNLTGIAGKWAEPGVRCERCHGPGGQHASNPKAIPMTIERDSALCEACHTYKDIHPASLEVANGFIQHQDQYGDLSQSKHQILDCLTCHDPHTGVEQLKLAGEQTTRLLCQDCHFEEAQFQNNPAHVSRNISCTDCHMPRLIQSGSANPQAHTADFRSHVVAINPRSVSQFNEDGSLASGQISLDFACRRCHGNTKSDAELIQAAVGYHTIPQQQTTP